MEHPPVSLEPATFKVMMDYLKENHYEVIAMRDMAKYIDPAKAAKLPRTTNDAAGAPPFLSIQNEKPYFSSIKSGLREFSFPGLPPVTRWKNNLVLTVTGSSNPYESWASTPYGLSGGNAAFDFDFDHDGIDNGLEWILGGNPANASLSVNPKATRDASGNLILTFTREEDSIGKATLTLEYGTSLANWNAFTIDADGGTDSNGVIAAINQAAEPDAVTITLPAPTGRIFARLKAVKSP